METDQTSRKCKIKHPLVSVIITNYNYASYLEKTIDSVLNQTHSRVEIIVVDDGSTDGSREVIEGYDDRIIPVFKENGGQASGFNAGFAVSHGELVCFLDADDLWLPHKVTAVVEAALVNPEAVLMYHRMQCINAEGVPYGKPWPYALWQGQITDRVISSGGWWRYPPTSGLCFRRAFLEQTMNIPEKEYPHAADAYVASLAPLLGKIVGLNEVLALYRIHGRNDHLNWNSANQCALFETNVRCLNETLNRLGITHQLDLENHWPYQYYKWELGEGYGPFQLSWKALKFPMAHPMSRFKNLLNLWKEVLGLKKLKNASKVLLAKP